MGNFPLKRALSPGDVSPEIGDHLGSEHTATVTLALGLPPLDLRPGEPPQEEGVRGMSRKEVSLLWAGTSAWCASLSQSPAAGSGMVGGRGCGAGEPVGVLPAHACLTLPGWRHTHQRTMSYGRRWRP